ncbi:hypothetical protein FRC08_008615, partial [Ceratobasidium sp. 394]
VGGHSAIYKFTKRAVCKPLVSRENLFYEAVERDAPPLLGFIPRYLGVMLVNYRRARRPSHPPTPALIPDQLESTTDTNHSVSPIRPPAEKAASDLPIIRKAPDPHSTDDELPEVALDSNTHMVPTWMLRGRGSALRAHYSTGSMDRATESTPELAYGVNAKAPPLATTGLQLSNSISAASSPLARQFITADSNGSYTTGAPTPANSPDTHIGTRGLPPHLSARLADSQSEGNMDTIRPSFLRHCDSHQGLVGRVSPESRCFDGMGFTTVNTRLKDHIFRDVLKKFRRRAAAAITGVRTEDEGDVADAEGEGAAGRLKRRGRFRRKRLDEVGLRKPCETPTRPSASFEISTSSSLRRVHSDGMLNAQTLIKGSPEQGQPEVKRGRSDSISVFSLEDDRQESAPPALNKSTRMLRSRSRSLGPSRSRFPSSRTKRGESLDRENGRAAEVDTTRKTLRRTASEDVLDGPPAKRNHHDKRRRGEVNIRLVDFAHTITNKEYTVVPPDYEDDQPKGKGYGTTVDPSGRLYARFPPHRPEEPDYGFLFGIKNLCSTLRSIWDEERARRHKAARDSDQRLNIDQLPALSTEGKQFFDEIFGTSHRSGDTSIDPGMLST